MKTEYVMATVMTVGVLGVGTLLAIEAALDRYERWRDRWLNRYVCPHCRGAVIDVYHGKGVNARRCTVCGAAWRIQ